jgi:hypothetical protein
MRKKNEEGHCLLFNDQSRVLGSFRRINTDRHTDVHTYKTYRTFHYFLVDNRHLI